MKKRITNNKGAVPLVVVIILIAAVAAAVLILGFLSNGFGFGGGSGDGTGSGNISAVSEVQSEPEESKPELEQVDFLNVTVSENDYLYQNRRFQLDELIDKLVTDAAETKVKVTDENASKRAYKNLINALEDEHIRYIKADA